MGMVVINGVTVNADFYTLGETVIGNLADLKSLEILAEQAKRRSEFILNAEDILLFNKADNKLRDEGFVDSRKLKITSVKINYAGYDRYNKYANSKYKFFYKDFNGRTVVFNVFRFDTDVIVSEQGSNE